MTSDQDALKQAAAAAAIAHIEPHLSAGTIVGVGTGSTADFFIDLLCDIRHKFDAAVSSSERSADRLRDGGVPVLDLNAAPEVAFYIDGADECTASLDLIKGGGGAMTREKIVASVADEFICIADESKLVPKLGAFGIPVEVIPMARGAVARALVRLGGRPVYREGVITDNGNIILDMLDMQVTQPQSLETEINNIVGVVASGIFSHRRADVLILAGGNGVRSLTA